MQYRTNLQREIVLEKQINANDQHTFSIVGVAVWLVCALFFPLIYGFLSFNSLLLATAFFLTSWFIGSLFLVGIQFNLFKSIIDDIISIILGSLVLVIFFYFTGPGNLYSSIVILLFLSTGFISLKFKRINFEVPEFNLFVAVALVFVLINVVTNPADFYFSISKMPTKEENGSWDPVFFTSLVTSLKNGFINSNWNEVGSPFNYQIGGFLAPAAFAAFTGISSHITLWGIWMPLYKVAGIILLSFLGYRLLENYYRIEKTFPLICIAIILLAPIHPIYLLKLDFANSIFLGSGYIIPGGNPPFTSSFVIAAIVLLLATEYSKKYINLPQRIIFVALLATSIIFKIPTYFCLGVLLGVVSLVLAYREKRYYLFFDVVVAFFLSLLLFYFVYESGGMQIYKLSFGFLLKKYAAYFGSDSLIKGAFIVIGLLIIWSLIRLGLVLYYLKYSNRNILLYFGYSIFILIFISTFPSLFIELFIVDTDGSILINATFDLEQFIRGAFFFTTVLALPGLILLFQNFARPVSKIILFFVFITFCISLSSIYSQYRLYTFSKADNTWHNEVIKELKNQNFSLLTIVPSDTYSGQLITASGFGPFWVTTNRVKGGYAMSNKNSWRWRVMEDGVSKDVQKQRKAYKILKQNNISYIISNPDNFEDFERFKKTNGLISDNNKWLIRL